MLVPAIRIYNHEVSRRLLANITILRVLWTWILRFNMSISYKRNGSKKHQSSGRGKLLVIVTSQYAVAFFSSLASAAAIFLVFGPYGTLFAASNVTTLAGVSILENTT